MREDGQGGAHSGAAAGTWDAAHLAEAVAVAAAGRSTALVVAHGGDVIVEEHWAVDAGAFPPGINHEELGDGRTREDVASTQKAVTALLVLRAVADGLVGLDEPVSAHLGPGWTAAPAGDERRITVRHLLTMTSGLDDDLVVAAAPGSVWRYNLGAAYHTLKRVVTAVVGRELGEVSHSWLFGPLGLEETEWRSRPLPPGLPEAARRRFSYPDGSTFEGLSTTARDLARLGQALCDPSICTTVLQLPEPLLREAWSTATPHNPAYGFLWWLNGKRWSVAPGAEARVDGWLLPDAPADTVAGLGALGRALYVSRDHRLVVVRLGADPGDAGLAGSSFGRTLWSHLRAASGAW